jgi:hypothetical protein
MTYSKTVTVAAAGAMTLLAFGAGATAQAGQLTPYHYGNQAKVMPRADQAAAVLWDNNVDDSGIGVVSMTFENGDHRYDSAAADDFEVPSKKTWTITEVDVTGQYYNGGIGPAHTETVTFYKSRLGKPRAILAQQTVTGLGNGAGSFAITLAAPVVLTKGKYEVSVVINMMPTNGYWAWENRTTMNGLYQAFWHNPGNGFGIHYCTKWRQEDNCAGAGQGPDHMFALVGSE